MPPMNWLEGLLRVLYTHLRSQPLKSVEKERKSAEFNRLCAAHCIDQSRNLVTVSVSAAYLDEYVAS
ncbi:hypothetical protein CWO91_29955 [Bradyrhizobium genosp. SA-3]|uniref:hypothetical protein n=1 Tax=Bradyrhizobium genosp. SA-3 TaxID=508868 RepID=UPI0010293485|nr:hypothetical protein [Bradyrhizobium genosp. SA-3]RZN06024.1 hypothetical protein CWO91_29955 [Bradyrhizobium genosp. SA-3]